MDYQWSIDELVFWSLGKGYSVDFVKKAENSICEIDKYIVINSLSSKENQFYSLLHECGHILVNKDSGVFDIKRKLKSLEESSSKFKTIRVIEEIEAWKKGYHLAKKLKLPVDDEKWHQDMTKAIGKYICWAAGDKKYNSTGE